MLFEDFSENLDLKNDLQNHLSQFPYISYSTKDDGSNIVLTFSGNISSQYVSGILEPFQKNVIEKTPEVKITVTGKKNVDKYEEFNGKLIIQNIELVDFPDFGLKGIESKVDTGATVSSIGVSKMKVDRQRKRVSFVLFESDNKKYTGKTIIKDLYSEIRVQSSNGAEQARPLIKTDIVVKGKTYETFISLSDREKMDYSVLLGKDLLVNFLVAPGL